MKLFGTYLVALALVALLAIFVWGWLTEERIIPEAVFAGLLGLVATVVGYAWLRDRR
jgi:membrane associated rhomboid family serine protease